MVGQQVIFSGVRKASVYREDLEEEIGTEQFLSSSTLSFHHLHP
jgi:hypothetical protein